MTTTYCTLFDSHYLTRGLALIQSLVDTGSPFKLYVFAMDATCAKILKSLTLESVCVYEANSFEDARLKQIRQERTEGEYCWTCTPVILEKCFDLDSSIEEVTYLDADLAFFERPDVLLEEFRKSKKSCLITEHRYTPRYDQTSTSGRFCVQFVTFRRNEAGLKILHRWKEQCLEWCFSRVEDGKFGDQKYLDQWPTDYPKDVHILQHLGGGVAPWNVQQYKISSGPMVQGAPLVFFHFHALRWQQDGSFLLCDGDYSLSRDCVNWIYQPYVQRLKSALVAVRKVNPQFNAGFHPNKNTFFQNLRKIPKRLYGAAKTLPA